MALKPAPVKQKKSSGGKTETVESKAKKKDLMSDGMDDEFGDSVDADDYDDDDDDEVLEDDKPQLPWKLIIGGGVAVLITIVLIVYFVTRPEPEVYVPPVVATPTPEPTPNPDLVQREFLYQQGIGSQYINEANVFSQGNLENDTFRQDFSQVDQPEMFALPIRITTVQDSVTYTKHRAVLDVGVEIYWVDGIFKGRNVTFTIPYSIYQIIAESGVLDVNVETVTDANQSVTVTSFTALPPTSYNK